MQGLPALGIEECILLPVPSTRGGVFLPGTGAGVDTVIDMVKDGTLTVGYSIPDEIKEKILKRGGIVYDACADECFLVGNAELTAIAALGILLTTEKRVPRDITFGVVGYGRIGKELTRFLLFLGARVRVFTTRPDVRLLLSEFGVATSESVYSENLMGIDILLNTAPAKIFDTECTAFSENMRVIDLASGNNFPAFPSVETYPSIPARMYPESSGELLAECALSYAERVLGEGGN